MCAFVKLMCSEPDLRLALAHGGVFTFGAPHVMYSSTSTSNEVAQVLAQCLGGSR
jgi:hypothetical protein